MTVFFASLGVGEHYVGVMCVHVYIYTQSLNLIYVEKFIAKLKLRTLHKQQCVLPSWITKLRPLLIRTVEATNPEPAPTFRCCLCNIF
jgi:hypothetical protein